MKSILLVSHGSRSAKTKLEIEALVQTLKHRSGVLIFRYAFLEIETPDIAAGIDQCMMDGATEVLVLLNFLNSGRHVNVDIPEIVAQSSLKYPHVKIHLSQPVGQHPKIADIFLEMIENA